jgi:hypothetical protein
VNKSKPKHSQAYWKIYKMDLPQISLEQWDMLEEEIIADEVEAAINEVHEISAPGPRDEP